MISKQKTSGFTLVELLITVAIVAILTSVALPTYTDFVARSNRSEAQRELLRVANLQEQFYVDSRAYTSDMTKLGLSNDPFVTANGHYSIDAAIANGGFVLTATALAPQSTNDSGCLTLSVNETGKKLPASACWEQ